MAGQRINKEGVDGPTAKPGGNIIIGRPIEGISVNGLEYLLDDSGVIPEFEDTQSAKAYLSNHGVSKSDLDYYVYQEQDHRNIEPHPANFLNRYTVLRDRRGRWLEVPVKELSALGLLNSIKIKNTVTEGMICLEDNGDIDAFLNARKLKGRDFKMVSRIINGELEHVILNDKERRPGVDSEKVRTSGGIRFTDTENRVLFTAPDGCRIGIGHLASGEIEKICECRIIDDKQFSIDGKPWYALQFADYLERNEKYCYPLSIDYNIRRREYTRDLDGLSITVDKDGGASVEGPRYDKIAAHILSAVNFDSGLENTGFYQIDKNIRLVTAAKLEKLKSSTRHPYRLAENSGSPPAFPPYYIISTDIPPWPVVDKTSPYLRMQIKNSTMLACEKKIFRQKKIFENSSNALAYVGSLNNSIDATIINSYKDQEVFLDNRIGTRKLDVKNLQAFLSRGDKKIYDYHKLLDQAAEKAADSLFRGKTGGSKKYYLYYRTPLGQEPTADIKVLDGEKKSWNAGGTIDADEYALVTSKNLPPFKDKVKCKDFILGVLKNHPGMVNTSLIYHFSEPSKKDAGHQAGKKNTNHDVHSAYER